MYDAFNEPDLETSDPKKQAIKWLIASALITAFLWQVPFGNYVLYPFTLLSTWFHEMGHGLTALLLGGSFMRLEIFPNASGVAYHTGVVPFLRPLVSMGGLLGPPIAGALFILAGRKENWSKFSLLALSAALLLSSLIWVRSFFGLFLVPVTGLIILVIGLKSPVWLQQLCVQFLGVQACISTYRQLDYLFTYNVVIGGNPMLSDTGQIAAHWLLPYWMWGTGIAVASLVLLIGSIRLAYK